MTDRNGKPITVGCRVKNPDGSTGRITGVVTTKARVHLASEVEVIPEHTHGDKAGDGDTIVWGT
jgi:hypothetical protein